MDERGGGADHTGGTSKDSGLSLTSLPLSTSLGGLNSGKVLSLGSSNLRGVNGGNKGLRVEGGGNKGLLEKQRINE